MAALVSLALSMLGGWPLATLRAVASALLEAIKTPLGAALVAGCVAWAAGHHAGWSASETAHAAAAARARAAAEAAAEIDRERARGDGLSLVARAAVRATLLEEIAHAPLPPSRPGDRCRLPTRRLRGAD